MEVSLEHTPTWAAATIFFFTIFVSYILKRSIDFTGTWLKRRQKISLYDAIDKLKEELMILGLLSLILAVVQGPISDICIPTKAADFMLPCSKIHYNKTNSSSAGHCAAQGKVSLVSQQGIHQLHIFIFILAVVHVLCGVVTMVLGRAKVFSNYLDALCYPYHHLILGILVVHAVSVVAPTRSGTNCSGINSH